MSVRIFISYARDDDEVFVTRLHGALKEAGFEVWFDQVSMPSRQLTFQQEIRDAISACDRLILVVGPGATSSVYVGEEWRFAYFESLKCVNPIVRLDGVDTFGARIDGYDLVPEDLRLVHAEDFRQNAKFDQSIANLIRQLRDPLPPIGKHIGVPELPPHYVDRPKWVNDLRNMLMADLHRPVLVGGASARVGVQGMGGIGKTVLATALAHRPEVRRAFPDGVCWIKLGQQPDIPVLQQWLIRSLGTDVFIADVDTGKEKLRELVVDRSVLLVLDDVWHRDHAEAFNVVGARGRLLLTTRDAGVVIALSEKGNHYQVELPTQKDAEALLAKAAGVEIDDLSEDAHQVITECGRLPLGLALCGGMMRSGILWDDITAGLKHGDLTYISNRHPSEERHENIWRAMGASVSVMSESERERFADLGMFESGIAIPEATLEVVWGHTGKLSRRHARALLMNFRQRSLIFFDENSRLVTLHDLLLDLAVDLSHMRVGGLLRLHSDLVSAYREMCPAGWSSGPDDGYFFQGIIRHMLASNEPEAARSLLMDLSWIEAKCRAGLSHGLDKEFKNVLEDERISESVRTSLSKMRSFVAKHLHIVAESPKTIYQAAWNSATGSPIAESAASALQARHFPDIWLAQTDRLPEPEYDPIIRSIAGSDWLSCVAIDAKRELLFVASSYYQVRVLDYNSGRILGELDRGLFGVQSLRVSPDGSWLIAVGGRVVDHSYHCHFDFDDLGKYPIDMYGKYPMTLWRLPELSYERTLFGHTENVTVLRDPLKSIPYESGMESVSISFSPDGQHLISGGADKTILSWNIGTGEPNVIGQHSGAIVGLSTAWWPDIVSFAKDGAVARWTATGCLFLRESGTAITSVSTTGPHLAAGTRDGRVLQFGRDGRAKEVASLASTVIGVASLKSGEVVALSHNGSLALAGNGETWRIELGARMLKLLVSSDGQRYAVSDYFGRVHVGILRKTPRAVWRGHFGGVDFLTEGTGHLITGGKDKMIMVWNWTGLGDDPIGTKRSELPDPSLRRSSSLPTIWRREDNLMLCFVTVQSRAHVAIVSAGNPQNPKFFTSQFDCSEYGISGIEDVAISQDMPRFATTGRLDGKVRVWDYELSRILGTYSVGSVPAHGVRFLEGGELILIGGWRSAAHVATTDGKTVMLLRNHSVAVTAVEASGKFAITGDLAGQLRLWDPLSGELFAAVHAHSGGVTAISASTRRGFIVSAGLDGFVRRWSLPDLNLQAEWAVSAPVGIAVSVNGSILVRQGTTSIQQSPDVPSLMGTDYMGQALRPFESDTATVGRSTDFFADSFRRRKTSFTLIDGAGELVNPSPVQLPESDSSIKCVWAPKREDGFVIFGWDWRRREPIIRIVGNEAISSDILAPDVLAWGPVFGVMESSPTRVFATTSATRCFQFDAQSGRGRGDQILVGDDAFDPVASGKDVLSGHNKRIAWRVVPFEALSADQGPFVSPRLTTTLERETLNCFGAITDRNARSLIRQFHLEREEYPSAVVQQSPLGKAFVIAGSPACVLYVWELTTPKLLGAIYLRDGQFNANDAAWSSSVNTLIIVGKRGSPLDSYGLNDESFVRTDSRKTGPIELITDAEIRAVNGTYAQPIQGGWGSTHELELGRVTLSADGSTFLASSRERHSNRVYIGSVSTGEYKEFWCGENREVVHVEWPRVVCLDEFEDRLWVLEIRDGSNDYCS